MDIWLKYNKLSGSMGSAWMIQIVLWCVLKGLVVRLKHHVLWKLDHAIITGVKERPITSLRGTFQMQDKDVAIFRLFLNSGTCMVSDRL